MELLAVIVLTLTGSMVSSAISTEQKTRIEEFVQAMMECRNMPGLSLAVVRGDETWTKAFGIADKERDISMTTDSMFVIASVTKPITSTLLAMLLDDTNGRLTWTSKVSDILGSDFAFVDKERTRETTLRDLFIHRTGLNNAVFALFAGSPHNFTGAEMARQFRYLPEKFPFRDFWDYNNWGYGLAGYIIEVLSGESFEETLMKRILQPLGMNNTGVIGQSTSPDDDNFAKPYSLTENQLTRTNASIYDIHPNEAAGAIASTADDMAKFMHFILRDGKTADNRSLISSALLKQTINVHESLPQNWIEGSLNRPTYPVSYVLFGYGYAWFRATYRGYRMFWHSGELHSYNGYLTFFPDLDLAIFTSTNGPGLDTTVTANQLISFYVLDVLLEEEMWLNKSTACTYPMPWEKRSSGNQDNSDVTNLPPECPECFTGVYGHQLYDDVEVKVEPGSGSLMLQYGRVVGSLNSTKAETTFKLDMWEPFRFFSRPQNRTILIPVVFGKAEKGKYKTIDLSPPYPYSMIFSRNIRFRDGKEVTTPKPTSGQELRHSNVKLLCLFITVSVYMAFPRE